jgi:LmbE family N-acetylglucosaminyl deacetylase
MRRINEILAGFEALPLAGVDEILGGQRALILAPHPDDESLGCGGLIAAACAVGLPPVVVLLTDGAASHPGSKLYPPARLAALRRDEVRQAARILGLPDDNLYCLGYPDGALLSQGSGLEAAVAGIAEIAAARGLGVVVGPWAGDPHCDHEAGAAIAAAVAGARGMALLSYPVWGWLAPARRLVDEPRQGGWRLDVSAYLPVKRRAIAAHESQYGALITDSPHGFQLPAELLAIFERDFEVFVA